MDDELRHRVIRKANGVEHDRPIDGMCRDHDVLAYQVHIGWPERLKLWQILGCDVDFVLQIARETDVIDERIKPDKRDVV